jgi:hypothetical protein
VGYYSLLIRFRRVVDTVSLGFHIRRTDIRAVGCYGKRFGLAKYIQHDLALDCGLILERRVLLAKCFLSEHFRYIKIKQACSLSVFMAHSIPFNSDSFPF